MQPFIQRTQSNVGRTYEAINRIRVLNERLAGPTPRPETPNDAKLAEVRPLMNELDRAIHLGDMALDELFKEISTLEEILYLSEGPASTRAMGGGY